MAPAWPFHLIVPTEITISEAAARLSGQLFMLVGAAVLIPFILACTAYAYWVFQGKVDPEAAYRTHSQGHLGLRP